MALYSSLSQQCFLDDAINLLPADAHPLTPEEHQAYLQGQHEGKVIDFSVAPPALMDVVLSVHDLCARVDAAADRARRAVAGDPLRAVEYDRAAAEAQAFKDAGYPADAVPRTVAAWAIGGRTAQQAADNILLESAAYTEALYQIREARLGAKELVRQAMAAGNEDQAQDIVAETIAAIQAAVVGIGNAGA